MNSDNMNQSNNMTDSNTVGYGDPRNIGMQRSQINPINYPSSILNNNKAGYEAENSGDENESDHYMKIKYLRNEINHLENTLREKTELFVTNTKILKDKENAAAGRVEALEYQEKKLLAHIARLKTETKDLEDQKHYLTKSKHNLQDEYKKNVDNIDGVKKVLNDERKRYNDEIQNLKKTIENLQN